MPTCVQECYQEPLLNGDTILAGTYHLKGGVDASKANSSQEGQAGADGRCDGVSERTVNFARALSRDPKTGKVDHRNAKETVRLIATVLCFFDADPSREPRAAVFTLTCKQRLSGHEFHRRYNSFVSHVLAPEVECVVVRVSARQGTGRWHAHLLVLCNELVQCDPSLNGDDSCSHALASIRRKLKVSLPRYGLGWRFDFSPIVESVAHVAHYLGKQLSPQHHRPDLRDKKVRRIAYGAAAKYWSGNFMLLTRGTAWWREQVRDFAAEVGCGSLGELQVMFGPQWVAQVRDFIEGKSIYPCPPAGQKDLPPALPNLANELGAENSLLLPTPFCPEPQPNRMTREERDDQDAAERYAQKRARQRAYSRAIAAGGPLANALTRQDPPPAPGMEGFNSLREQHCQRSQSYRSPDRK